MRHPLTVALVVSSPDWRGSVTSFAKVADGLKEAGHQAFFVTAHPTLTAPLRAKGYDVEELGAVRTGPRELWRMRNILVRRGVTTLYADMPRDLRLAALAGRITGARAVWRFNVSIGHTPADLLTRLAVRWSSAVVVLSDWIAARLSDGTPWVGRRPLVRIPNGFDTDIWTHDPEAGPRVRLRLGLSLDRPLIFCPSVFARRKRQEFVIEALEKWPLKSLRPVLVLAGGEESAAPFLERARASTVDIRFLGHLQQEGLRELYSAADVVTQASVFESFGNVIGEAMCCEATVLVPDEGGPSEVVGPATEGAGVIRSAEDAEGWARTMAELVADPARRAEIGRRARARIAREFPIEKMQRAHVTLFESLAR